MIGVEGQYLCNFNLGELKDFIPESDFIKFTLIEQAGNVLPEFSLSFWTREENILPRLNEANDLDVIFGKDKSSQEDIKLAIMGLNSSGSSGGDKRLIALTGLYSALPYISNTKMSISDNISGVEVIKNIASQYFKTDSTFNIEKSEDSQRWIQPNWTDRKYISEVWLHSWLSDSFIACGISSAGEFILKDMKKMGDNFKWKFTQRPENLDKDISYDTDFGINIKSGFINNWVGYGQEKHIYNVETGEEQVASENVKPVLALTNQVVKRAELEKRSHQMGFVTGNTHIYYWRAFLKNLTNLGVFGNVKLTVSFHNQYKPIKVLDLVMFKDDKVASEGETAEYHSGLYFVSKVARTIHNKQFVTVVELVRESFNTIRGDNLKEVSTEEVDQSFSSDFSLEDDEVILKDAD